jgi:hypothetical protein
MTSSILRLYQQYEQATEKASRSMGDEHQARVTRIEADIRYLLSREPGGIVVEGTLHFRLYVVTIGQEKRSLSYFRATSTEERRVPGAVGPGWDGGFSFARRKTDGPEVLPVSATHKPSLRRKHEVAR